MTIIWLKTKILASKCTHYLHCSKTSMLFNGGLLRPFAEITSVFILLWGPFHVCDDLFTVIILSPRSPAGWFICFPSPVQRDGPEISSDSKSLRKFLTVKVKEGADLIHRGTGVEWHHAMSFSQPKCSSRHWMCVCVCVGVLHNYLHLDKNRQSHACSADWRCHNRDVDANLASRWKLNSLKNVVHT